jgi:hypothetical protein
LAAEVSVRPATLDDALAIAAQVRDADRDEIWALSRRTPREALVEGLSTPGGQSFVAHRGTRLLAMFGLVPLSIAGGVYGIWLIGTDEMFTAPKEWLRTARAVIAYWRKMGDLVNIVHEKHSESIRFLEWLGAEFAPAVRCGPAGEMFYPFILRGHSDV